MKVGGSASYFIRISSKTELQQAVQYAKDNSLAFRVVGEGTNSLFSDQGYDGLIIKNEIKGTNFINSGSATIVEIGAGENWDKVVSETVSLDLTGIEALSHIPGSAGAAPVQNIGAYGQELSDTLISVEIYNTETNAFETILAKDCEFSYRDSRFKHNHNEIIVGFKLKLKIGAIQGDLYDSLAAYLESNTIKDRSPKTIRAALEDLRWSKLPKPNELPNCGSYFHNIIVDGDTLQELLKEFPNLRYFKFNRKFKIATGWLLDQLGLKGYCDSNGFCNYDKQALVIANSKNGTYQQLVQHENMIRKMVRDRYGLELTREPILID